MLEFLVREDYYKYIVWSTTRPRNGFLRGTFIGKLTEVQMSKKRNDQLSDVYEMVYGNGSENFFSETDGDESKTLLSMCPDFTGKKVLEIGCGEGDLALSISDLQPSRVIACDYSQNAINIANSKKGKKNVQFLFDNWKNINEQFDIIIMEGVLEHFDKPFEDLKYMMNNLLCPGGMVITSSPSFINPRGYVWMTLALLLDVPMSLTDLHFITPWQFEEFARANGYMLKMKSCDFRWGCGDLMIKDYKKRLFNALRDANLKTSGVPKLIDFLEKAIPYFNIGENNGATMVYALK